MQELALAETDIKYFIEKKRIVANEIKFSGGGETLDIAYQSTNLKSKLLKDEITTLLTTVDNRVQQSPYLPLRTISIIVRDNTGKPGARIEVNYNDYKDYKAGNITFKDLRSRWKETQMTK